MAKIDLYKEALQKVFLVQELLTITTYDNNCTVYTQH